MPKVLLNIITDRLSHLEGKGELTSRYYNPGEVFDEVHILMTNGDQADAEKLQKLVGNASLHIHNLESGKALLFKSLFWRPSLLKGWAAEGIRIARKIKPDLVRCYGNYINGMVAAEIKKELGIPYVVSLHTHPDENRSNLKYGWKNFLYYHFTASVENYTLRNADKVAVIYESLLPYITRRRIKQYETVYNTVNPDNIFPKPDYMASEPLKILSVGRLIPGKRPDFLIKAAKKCGVELTLVGDGPLREELEEIAENSSGPGKTVFVSSMDNDELCRTSREYDLFAIHCDYNGIPKTILEASLCGLPIIVNKRPGTQIPEYSEKWIKLVDNSVDGYSRAIEDFHSESEREHFGLAARKFAESNWHPQETEARYAALYKELSGC